MRIAMGKCLVTVSIALASDTALVLRTTILSEISLPTTIKKLGSKIHFPTVPFGTGRPKTSGTLRFTRKVRLIPRDCAKRTSAFLHRFGSARVRA
jgi:hypothetical protein